MKETQRWKVSMAKTRLWYESVQDGVERKGDSGQG
jgi:hypothetical protein